jgi:transposase
MKQNLQLNISYKECIKAHIIKNNHYKQNHNSLYTLDDILNVIEYVMITGASWRSLNLPIFNGKIKWQSIYYHFNKFCKLDIFKKVYLELLDTYFKSNKSGKLKYLSVDTSFVKNEYASDTNFGYCKKKRTSKLSMIVDSNGISLSALLDKGSTSDQAMLFSNLEATFVDIIYRGDNNKHKRYILADSIYDTTAIHEKIKSLGIQPIISPNKRNTKDKKKIEASKLKGNKKKIYKKRTIIENCFSWLYKNRRLCKRYDKKNSTYMSFLFLVLIKIILKRMAG